MTFQEQCREAARKFLQTVVLVDDQADYSGEAEKADNNFSSKQARGDVSETNSAIDAAAVKAVETEEDADNAKAAGETAVSVVEDTAAYEVENDISEPDEFDSVQERDVREAVGLRPKEDLDAGAITRGFAESGLICSILKPSASEPIEDEVSKVAPKSDVIVLDWEMGGGDSGDTTIKIIQKVFDCDKKSGERLRLIAIYTGIRDLHSISERLDKEFAELQIGAQSLELHNQAGTIKVVVLGKGLAADHEKGQERHCVEEDGLAERLVEEFAHFSGGLLRNATLASMGHLRSNTHRLLARFNNRLDGPLVTHYALLGSPEDAQQYVADLILQEIEAQIPLSRVSRTFAGYESVKALMDEKFSEELEPQIIIDKKGDKTFPITTANAKSLAEVGAKALKDRHEDIAKARLEGEDFETLADEAKAEKIKTEKERVARDLNGEGLAERLYCLFGDEYSDGVKNHEEFSIASGIKRSNNHLDGFEQENLPSVKLGTIIHDGGHYYVCLTPVCDSVRRKDPANFLFGRLFEDKKKFNVVLDDKGTRKRLFLNRKDAYLKTFELRPSADGTVRAEMKDGDAFVTLASVGKAAPAEKGEDKQQVAAAAEVETVRWVAEMKPMQAQRLVGAVTSNLSRIGLDEFEWLRMLADNWSG
ncbi:Uncharacterised protein [Pannonibacter phragmitetus]|uniref:Response receiver domain-containing protein n=1 Tax=Pannonibacter phragmitetus TaxID=121719 RepID=A0A378ZXG8_9HYPH|nr:response regulator receiver domain [Pannonibacter phragmitetus]SUB01925.1 Uncharacterised protein [Pannonibacter phragmitetus]